MENNLIKTNYNNEEVVFKVENGISYVRVDEVAKFCGWTNIANSGNEVIRWSRLNDKLKILGVANVGHGDFIPENTMYPLIGMADLNKNEKARNFMTWVGQVLTEIRSTGKYDTIEHEIMKIEDEEERRLTLAVHRLQQVYEIDKDEFTALRLENKQLQLDRYKDSKKLKQIEDTVIDIDNKIKKATVLREGDMSAEVIAKKFNIFSTTGKPHNRFADNMAKVLGFYINPEGNSGYSNQYVSVNLTTRGGITIPTLKYSKLAFKEMEQYINDNGLHIEQPPVYYKRKCKGGNVGDFNYGRIIFDETEESIKINKITYDLYSENETEE